jgi:hypothetical protein
MTVAADLMAHFLVPLHVTLVARLSCGVGKKLDPSRDIGQLGDDLRPHLVAGRSLVENDLQIAKSPLDVLK